MGCNEFRYSRTGISSILKFFISRTAVLLSKSNLPNSAAIAFFFRSSSIFAIATSRIGCTLFTNQSKIEVSNSYLSVNFIQDKKYYGWNGYQKIINWKKTFVFKDFVHAFAFLTQVAFEAEKQQHHPEIFNVYNKVTLKLQTHDAGNIVTEKIIP